MITRHLATACLVYLSVVMQSTIASDLTAFGAKPWFPGMALVACLLLHEGVAFLVWSALLGFFVDGLSPERFGLNIVIATFVAMGLLMAKQEIRSFGAILTGIFVLGGTIGWRIASAVTSGLLSDDPRNIGPLLTTDIEMGVYSAMLVFGMFLLLKMLKAMFIGSGRSSQTVLTNEWMMLTKT